HKADDVVATLTEQVLRQGLRVVIGSPDKDFKQLISEDVQIVMPMPEFGQWSFYTLKHYIAQYNCDPSSDLSFRCIVGNEVDGVPGIQHVVPGFGRKTALKLVKKHGSLENLLSAAAVRTVGKQYVQDALSKHGDYLQKNYQIHGGTLRASDDFSTIRYLIKLSTSASSALSTNKGKKQSAHSPMEENLFVSSYTYEDITIKDVMLDSNYRGGGISVINSLRTTIDNCCIVHFTTNGVLVQSGHETYIRNLFLGQHITAGRDHNVRNFSGTGINLMGNDNAVTDVIIFSVQIGVMVSGQANVLTRVHCYNKATGWGGTGIYLRLPGLTQTHIINCYMDYTGIVVEDPVQLHISSSFFLGDAFIIL
ncbi:hypothetical protein GIB67_038980, partial [Kingdonia uniflora]